MSAILFGSISTQTLGVDGGTAVAIEDNVIGLASAKAAGVRTIAFPNPNTADRDFDAADQRVDRLDPDALISAA
jgi:beta-phosphoglucomutase-like phosphatase (HAD superfamily)